MKKSNLSQQILKNIWSISTHNTKGLNRNEFFIALRLIALAQNGFPCTKNEIENNSPIPPLPFFTSLSNSIKKDENNNNNNNNIGEEEIDESAYEIPETCVILYRKYFENNKDCKDNYISTKKAIEMWKGNKMNDFTIKKVANSLIPLERHGFLNLKEFQVANHLLSICNYQEITKPLPNCLLKFLGRPLNKEKPKKIKNNYKNFNDYVNKTNEKYYIPNPNDLNDNDNNNDNNLNIKKDDEDINFNEKKRQSLPNNNNIKNRISYLNENEYQKCKSNEVGDNENKKDINEEIKVNNSINKNENKDNINNKDSLENNEIIDDNNKKDDLGLNINHDKSLINNKNNYLKNKTIDINNNKIIDDFLSDKNIVNKNDEFFLNTNDNNDNKNFESRKIKGSYNNFNIKKNKNNINYNNLNNNNNILQKLIRRIEELEIKSNDNNSKISFLISKINNLQKEQ